MTSKGIMRRARLLYVVPALLFVVPPVLAQATDADKGDDLDVTMRVIVDPDAKVPDEIVRKIPLPKPAPPAAQGKPDEKPKDAGKPADDGKPADSGKPADPGKPKDTGKPPDAGKPPGAAKPPPPGRASQAAPDIREQGRAFGQQVAEEAKDRSEDARRHGPPQKPPKPPKQPKPPKPPR
jgi:hypothetical protein